MAREGVPQHATGRRDEIRQLLLREPLARALQAVSPQQGLPPWQVPEGDGNFKGKNLEETVDLTGLILQNVLDNYKSGMMTFAEFGG